ncbi:hypothetical protein ACFXGT_11520 [Streptomyces sp. NPDC059352]|uniref:hypothetical protein n=1 Tax=Streptomyces sp. NPDC059352 TaxID=3346810 RepID=UPI00367AA9D7
MSTVPTPTPADVFRRKAHPLIAPGPHDPATDEPFRSLWERGITGSRMHRNTKLTALTLAAGADWTTGQLADTQPSVGGLADRSALHHGQVVVALQALEQRGWIVRSNRRLPWGNAAVELAIPGPILRHLKKHRLA